MRRVLFFSFHYPPDQSAGSVRTSALVRELVCQDPAVHVTVFCSVPRRYGLKTSGFSSYHTVHDRIRVRRFWIPFFGQGSFSSAFSYIFYFAQAVPAAIWLRPDMVIGTSAKLLTSFAAACAARFTGADLYIDFRDTFADNFFYFYRWHKRILLQSVIMAIENLVLRSARSINMVSIGFKDAFVGWERILDKYSISLTNYPNGISRSLREQIKKTVPCSDVNNLVYRVVYAGNLGEGQDLLGLLENLVSRPDLQGRMHEEGIRFDIFGSGAQLEALEELVADGSAEMPPGPLAHLVRYCGLVPRGEVQTIYANADCLMLQLGLYSSLSMVIPTKVFEYAATPCPILYGASGFTGSFIGQISGTISFAQCSAESFLAAILSSRAIHVSTVQRGLFLDEYDAGKIYVNYSRHILGLEAKVS